MRNKTGILALVLGVLCVCLTGMLCFWSFSQIEEANEQISVLESEVRRIENLQSSQGAFNTESIKTEEETQAVSKSNAESAKLQQTETQIETESDSGDDFGNGFYDERIR